ncbi:alpha-ketoglutarate-dependent dioxygenase AlkB [Methylocella sp.]|uniref:alpha-ketoglutarate-dependent dioxygenase AlkB n=1 Tax=Methylocella sp. TaxID=1978226 RepID=UPI0035AE0198
MAADPLSAGLLGGLEPTVELAPGLLLARSFFDAPAQRRLAADVAQAAQAAPFFRPRMPRSGKPFSVLMTNCGELGWISDESGYRYEPRHPATGASFPPIPALALSAWRALAGAAPAPQACLVNYYDAGARMGLHRDADEGDFLAPVVSISLGDDALFRYGGANRSDRTKSVRLRSGDVVVLGGPSRLAFHGIDRIYPATSGLLPQGGRLNLTLRRVSPPP